MSLQRQVTEPRRQEESQLIVPFGLQSVLMTVSSRKGSRRAMRARTVVLLLVRRGTSTGTSPIQWDTQLGNPSYGFRSYWYFGTGSST